MNPEELLAIFAQMGIPPEQRMAMLQWVMSQGQQPLDPYMGATDFDVKEANKLVDYGRDINTLMADPMTAATAGMGAYGGANEIGFQAFDPISGPPKPVAAPDRQLLDRYLQRPVDDIGGWIADQIANQGATAFEIVGQLQQILNHGPWDDPELEARRSQLAQMVPSYTDEMTGQTRWDYSGIETLANKLEEQSVAQPEPGSYQDTEGNWWQQGETEASPMTQWYQKQGLPLPTQEYTLDDFTPEGAAYQQQADALKQAYNTQAPLRSQLDANSAEAYEKMIRLREVARQQPNRTPQEAGLDYRAIQQNTRVPIPDPNDNTMQQSQLDAMWNQVAQRTPGAPTSTGVGVAAPNRPTVGPATPGSYLPPGVNDDTGYQGTMSLMDTVRNAIAGGKAAVGGARTRAADAADPTATKRAMADYLMAARGAAESRQPAIDQWMAQQRANGRRFYQGAGRGFEPDVGVGQGRLNYGVAKAQGRTPLQDALRARAMAAFMMGG